MYSKRRALRLLLAGIVAIVPLFAGAQVPQTEEPDALKRADAAFRAGFAANQAGSLEDARAKFAEVVQFAPQIPEGHAALGEVLFELGKPAEAARELQTALELKPGDAGFEANLALAYEKTGEAAKAIPLFKAAYEHSQEPNQPAVDAAFCEAYGRALAATGNRPDAIAMFQGAVDRGGNTADLFDDLGSLYAQTGDWSQARPQFEHALGVDGSYVAARIHLGIVQREEHDIGAATASLQAAVDLDARNALAHLELGKTLAQAGQDEAAIPHLELAAKLNANLPGVQSELAMALQRQGRQQEAIPWFQGALERDPHDVGSTTNLALALTLTGRAKEALPLFQQALAASPSDPTIRKDLGGHIQLSAFNEAIEEFKAALVLAPDDPQLHYELGMAYKLKTGSTTQLRN